MAQKYIVGDVVMYKNRIHTIIDIYLHQMVMNYLM